MAAKTRSYTGWQILLLLLVLGGIIGGWIGEAMVKFWPALGVMGKVQSIGVPSFTVNLQVFTLTFGFMLHINLFTIIGFIIAYLMYRKL